MAHMATLDVGKIVTQELARHFETHTRVLRVFESRARESFYAVQFGFHMLAFPGQDDGVRETWKIRDRMCATWLCWWSTHPQARTVTIVVRLQQLELTNTALQEELRETQELGEEQYRHDRDTARP